MTTITAKIPNAKDVKIFKDLLERFGIPYTIDDESTQGYVFTDAQMADFEQSKQEFVDGKTTAKSWDDIKKNLESVYP